MMILGIESSCDETACAVVENGTKVLSSIVASSAEMHAKTGGVIPENAARKQVELVIPVINEGITNSNHKIADIDAIAVTSGPGLIGSLLVGVETAKTLAMIWGKPIIPVNHLVAHIYANFIGEPPQFPALALVVSGGHTDLVLMHTHGRLVWIGGTRDDAAGECFDKCARLLNLPYPGGPNLSREADKFLEINNQQLNMFPRPLIHDNSFDWSFSGLKTAVLRSAQDTENLGEKTSEIAANVQEAIVDCLVSKTVKAIEKYKPKSFLLAGGVAANSRLREKFSLKMKQHTDTKIYFPEVKYCTDNAVTIASYAYFNCKPEDWKQIEANPELTIVS